MDIIQVIDTIINGLVFVSTTFLTILVLIQNSKLSKKQQLQDIDFNNQQEIIQKKQIRLETFSYKNEIYKSLYKVFQLTGEIESTFINGRIDLKQKDLEQLHDIFSIYLEGLKIDVCETLWLCRQAEFIFPPNIYEPIGQISKDFDDLTGDISKFKIYVNILTISEVECEKIKLIDDIFLKAKRINKHVSFIENIMPRELCMYELYQ